MASAENHAASNLILSYPTKGYRGTAISS